MPHHNESFPQRNRTGQLHSAYHSSYLILHIITKNTAVQNEFCKC